MMKLLPTLCLIAIAGCATPVITTGPDAGTQETDGAVEATCGDGVQQGSEECDDGAETWECDRECHQRRLYVACESTDDCATGQSCIEGACASECGFVDGELQGCPGELPEVALEMGCYVVGYGRGYCRPSCETDTQCPADMQCVPATNGAYGTCFPR